MRYLFKVRFLLRHKESLHFYFESIKLDFDQLRACRAPVRCSKYTTYSDLQKYKSSVTTDLNIDHRRWPKRCPTMTRPTLKNYTWNWSCYGSDVMPSPRMGSQKPKLEKLSIHLQQLASPTQKNNISFYK